MLVNAADDGICIKSQYKQHSCDSIYIGNCTVRSSASATASGVLNSSANFIRVVPVLGAVFSGFCLAMDADRLQRTVAQIKAGDPSEKAMALLQMVQELRHGGFPAVDDFVSECKYHLELIGNMVSNQMPQ